MADVFRILDRLNITGRGTLYKIKNYMHSNIRLGDILYDLQSNRFKVTGLDMVGRVHAKGDYDDTLIGLMFELIDGVEAEGNILVRNPKDISFIFCNHPLYPKRVDEDYEEEFQEAGLEHACALFSYEDLENGELSLYGEDISGLAIYRGWMMKPDLYRSFYNKLEEKGIILINTPEEYERYHLLPGWYDDFKDDTAKSVWEDQGTVESVLLLTNNLQGPYIVKDYVKSRKHEWYDACFINNIADKANVEKVIRNFIERQDSNLVGGVVLRQFEKLKSIGFHEKSGMPISEEYRVFVYAGRIMLIDNYWQADKMIAFSDEECFWIEALVKKLKSSFVTMDIARREDGRLIIMELGDGQVSGLQQIKPADFYRAFNENVRSTSHNITLQKVLDPSDTSDLPDTSDSSDENLAWEEVRTEHIVQDEWIDFRRSAYRFPDGTVFEPYYSYSRKDYVVIVATDEDGNYLCVKQYRQGIGEVTTEFPAGGVEVKDSGTASDAESNMDLATVFNKDSNKMHNANEADTSKSADGGILNEANTRKGINVDQAFEAARRELKEETGYESDEWEHLITVPSNATIADNYAFIFTAKNCRKVSRQKLDDTEFLNVRKYTDKEIADMVDNGKFQQAVHIMAWLMAKRGSRAE